MRKKSTRRSLRGRLADPRRRYQARHKAMGLCTLCPRPLAKGSTALCEWHRHQKRERTRRLRGPIPCQRCHRPLPEATRRQGRRYHPRCLRAVQLERERSPRYRRLHAFAARAYQLRHAAQGLCTQCPRPAVPGKHVCEWHLRYRKDRYRRLRSRSPERRRMRSGPNGSGHSGTH